MSDSIVNKWLIVRYMVVGVYVGCVTVAGFAWWYMYYSVSLLFCCHRLSPVLGHWGYSRPDCTPTPIAPPLPPHCWLTDA